jgi:hypothetical protein
MIPAIFSSGILDTSLIVLLKKRVRRPPQNSDDGVSLIPALDTCFYLI